MDINQNKLQEPTEEQTLDVLKELSLQDFLNVGLNQIAYIRCAKSDESDAENSYIVYAADGSQISVMDSYDTAMAAIQINDLLPVTLN